MCQGWGPSGSAAPRRARLYSPGIAKRRCKTSSFNKLAPETLSCIVAFPSLVLALSYSRTRRRPTLRLTTFPKHVSVLGAGEEIHGDRTRQGVQHSYRDGDWRDSEGCSGTDTPWSRRRRAGQARRERIVF